MNKASLFTLGAVAAVFSTACISILGKFEVGDCPAGQTLVDGTCAPVDGNPITAKSCGDLNAPQCGDKFVCSDSEGKAVCVCGTGHSGAECATCGEGLQDNDKNGTCEKTCAAAAPTCGVRSACDDTTGTPRCACTLGYGLGADGVCVFTGGPKDPEFVTTGPSPWAAAKGTFDPFALTEGQSTGMLTLTPEVCATPASWGTIRQTFDMPTAANAEPIALKIKAKAVCGGDAGSCYGSMYLGHPFSQTPLVLGSATTWSTLTQCLGERAYGPGVDLTITSTPLLGRGSFCAIPTRQVLFDSIGFVADPTCPAIGTTLNGTFESNVGWTASGAGAEVVASVGNGGSRGGRLAAATACDQPSLTGLVAPPSSMASPALVFSYKGTLNKEASVAITAGFSPVGLAKSLRGTGTYRDAALCVPELVKGTSTALTLQMNSTYAGTPGGDCAKADAREFIFDDFRFESRPDLCPAKTYLVDGGFENDTSSNWTLGTPYYSGMAYIYSGGAHGGSRYLYASANQQCASFSVYTTFGVPPADDKGGPVLRFYYQLNKAGTGTYSLYAGNTSFPLTTNTTGWTEGKVCLSPSEAGKAGTISVYGNNGTSTTCGTYQDAGYLYLDDFTVGTDPSCPSQVP